MISRNRRLLTDHLNIDLPCTSEYVLACRRPTHMKVTDALYTNMSQKVSCNRCNVSLGLHTSPRHTSLYDFVVIFFEQLEHEHIYKAFVDKEEMLELDDVTRCHLIPTFHRLSTNTMNQHELF